MDGFILGRGEVVVVIFWGRFLVGKKGFKNLNFFGTKIFLLEFNDF